MNFNLDDPMLEHVQTRAAQLGITAEEFAQRALADYIQGENAPIVKSTMLMDEASGKAWNVLTFSFIDIQ